MFIADRIQSPRRERAITPGSDTSAPTMPGVEGRWDINSIFFKHDDETTADNLRSRKTQDALQEALFRTIALDAIEPLR